MSDLSLIFRKEKKNLRRTEDIDRENTMMYAFRRPAGVITQASSGAISALGRSGTVRGVTSALKTWDHWKTRYVNGSTL